MVSSTNKAQETSHGQTFIGEVVSDKMDKTIVVKIVRTLKHPIFGKVVRRHKKYKAHDADGRAKLGDTVEIQECRPLSKTKYMTLVRVLEKTQN